MTTRPGQVIANADPGAILAARADEVRAAIARVVAGGCFVLGPEVEAFEREFGAWLGAPFCVAVGNGTDALEFALRATGIRPGDGVVAPANTASATIAAIVASGAQPILCDVDPATMCLSPERLTDLLASPRGASARAVVPVHLYGHPCAMAAIDAAVRARGLVLVEDCAQAHGAVAGGRPAGAWGQAAAFSFYPTKNLAALGDGGAVVTRDRDVAERVRGLRQYGWRERHVSADPGGRNSRLDEIQAAILRVRLRYLDAENRRRRALAERYFRALEGVRCPPRPEGADQAVFHQFTIRISNRDALVARLAEQQVVAQTLYPVPVHRQPAFHACAPAEAGALATCEQACAEVVNLPVHPALADGDVDWVATQVLAWVREGGPGREPR